MSPNWQDLDDIPVQATWREALSRSAVSTSALPEPDRRGRRRLAPIVLAAASVVLVAAVATVLVRGDETVPVAVSATERVELPEVGPVGAVAGFGEVVWFAPSDPSSFGGSVVGYDLVTEEVVSELQTPVDADPIVSLSVGQNWVVGLARDGEVIWWSAGENAPPGAAQRIEANASALGMHADGSGAYLLLTTGEIASLDFRTGDLAVAIADVTSVWIAAGSATDVVWSSTEAGLVHRNGVLVGELEGRPQGLVALSDGVVGVVPDGGGDGQFRFVSQGSSAFVGFGASGTPVGWAPAKGGLLVVQDSGRIVWLLPEGNGIGTIGWLPDAAQGSSAPDQIAFAAHPLDGPILVTLDGFGTPTVVQLEEF